MRQNNSTSVFQTVIVLLSFCSLVVEAQDVPLEMNENGSGYSTATDEAPGVSLPSSSENPLIDASAESKHAASEKVNANPSPLADRLADQLGITSDQGAAGAGSIFRYVKQKMSPEEFRKIHSLIPDFDQIVDGGPAAEISSLSDQIGDTETKDPELAAILLKNDFDQFGLAPDMLGKFVPVIVEYVKSQGGEPAANLLQNALAGI